MVSVKKTDVAELEDAANLRATARRLGQACAAEKVILFGSRASGRASAESDVDLALILPDGSNARATLNIAHRLLWPRKFPIDLVVITATVWAGKSTLLAREIEAHGIMLYERGAV
jgi:predicted nucleotidyltransferase